MTFHIYNTATSGSPLWTETYPAVQVSDGLFHILLGSTTPLPQNLFSENSTLYLGITVGADDEMTPREQLASAPWAIQAMNIADGSVTTDKVANGAITQAKAPSLIKSANGDNEIIRSGNQVFQGTDANGFIRITYPCFPNGVRVFFAINGRWNANHSQVVATNGGEKCGTTIKLSPSTSNPIRIHWIAIGN